MTSGEALVVAGVVGTGFLDWLGVSLAPGPDGPPLPSGGTADVVAGGAGGELEPGGALDVAGAESGADVTLVAVLPVDGDSALSLPQAASKPHATIALPIAAPTRTVPVLVMAPARSFDRRDHDFTPRFIPLSGMCSEPDWLASCRPLLEKSAEQPPFT